MLLPHIPCNTLGRGPSRTTLPAWTDERPVFPTEKSAADDGDDTAEPPFDTEVDAERQAIQWAENLSPKEGEKVLAQAVAEFEAEVKAGDVDPDWDWFDHITDLDRIRITRPTRSRKEPCPICKRRAGHTELCQVALSTPMLRGKHKGQAVGKVPVDYLRWYRKQLKPDGELLTAIEIVLDGGKAEIK